jgi:hypothetical protein
VVNGPGAGPQAPSVIVGAGSRLARVVRSPSLPALAVLLVALAVSLREALRATGGRLIYALDDAYIHMAVARTWALHSIWGCTPFHFSSSSSSLLWTFALGLAYRIGQVRDWTPLVLNVVLALGAVLVANRSLKRLGMAPLVRGAALVGIVVAFPLPGMVLLGMEHILHLLLTIAFAAQAVEALSRRQESEYDARHRTLSLCVLGALLAASRYEGFFLVGLACLGFLARRQLGRAIWIGVAALVPVAAFGLYSVANGAYFLPNPLMVKAVGESASTLSALLKPFGSEDLAFLKNNRAMPILLALSLAAALAHFRRRRSVLEPPVLLALLLAGMILLHGHFVFSPLYWAYRYDAYLVGFGIFVAAVALGELPSPRALPEAALPALLVVLLVPVLADVREGLHPAAEIEGMRGTYLEQFQTAEFIRAYYPEDAVIVNDLGAVTYYTDARILDLVGLGDIEPVRIMRRASYTSRDVLAWTARYKPKLAIVSLGWSVVVPLVPPDWVSVAVVEEPPHFHRVGFFAVERAEAWPLRASVEQYYQRLAPLLGHRVKLRRPEDLEAVAGTR